MKIIKITLFLLWFLFNILMFRVAKTNLLSYLFTNLSFLIEGITLNKVFLKEQKLKNHFLNISIIYVSTIYWIIQILTFILSIILSTNLWFMDILLLGLWLIFLSLSITGKKEIKKTEEKTKQNQKFIRTIKQQIESLIEETDEQKLNDLLEQIRYSDPISHEEVKKLEKQIQDKIEELKINLDKKKIEEIKKLLSKRNRELKDLK